MVLLLHLSGRALDVQRAIKQCLLSLHVRAWPCWALLLHVVVCKGRWNCCALVKDLVALACLQLVVRCGIAALVVINVE